MSRSVLYLALIAASLSFACKDDEPDDTSSPEGDTDTDTDADTDADADADTDTDTDADTDTEFNQLVAYLGDNDMDLPAMLTDWTINPQDLFDLGVETYFIIDIRTGDYYEPKLVDFEEGHIAGAHSVAMADAVTYEAANNTDHLPVIVVCYTGTTAAQTTMALRLAGVDAKSLMWGMSGWHSDFDMWTANLADAALDYDTWSTDAAPALESFDTPTIATGETGAEAILSYQLANEVLDSAKAKTIADVMGAPEDYQIFNYWAEADYNGYGHIEGAFQLTPGEIGIEDLGIFDPTMPIVIYCWSGQTAMMFASWLQTLGYEAYGLKFSANGLIYSSLNSHIFPGAVELSYDTGAE